LYRWSEKAKIIRDFQADSQREHRQETVKSCSTRFRDGYSQAKHTLEYEIDRDSLRKRLQNLYFQDYGQITKPE
jgi:hypothetical protein